MRKLVLTAYGIKNNLAGLNKLSADRAYEQKIKNAIGKKELVLALEYGGLGDVLVFTTLPRLLTEKYGLDFYLDENSRKIFRHSDILKLCFELNPYFKGFKPTNEPFYFHRRAKDRGWLNLLTDWNGKNLTTTVEEQFDVLDRGLPEIYYQPKKLSGYEKTVLVDLNFLSGHKLGWYYDLEKTEKLLEQYRQRGFQIEYVDPKKQDLFAYADMIYSAHKFITVLSGGAALAAALKSEAIVFLPANARGESVYNFVFPNSPIGYL